jgi:hypothetical protein
MKPVKLRAMYHPGAGWQIDALIPTVTECVEFSLKADFQPCVQCHDNVLQSMLGYEPFIQFAPEEWKKMIGETFTEMVNLWNEKYAKILVNKE